MESTVGRLSFKKRNEKPSFGPRSRISINIVSVVDGLMDVKVLLLPTRRVTRGKLRCDVGKCARSVRSGDLVGVVRSPNSISSGSQIELSEPSRVVLRRVHLRHGVLTYRGKEKMILVSVFLLKNDSG